jgi:hypothetical protein
MSSFIHTCNGGILALLTVSSRELYCNKKADLLDMHYHTSLWVLSGRIYTRKVLAKVVEDRSATRQLPRRSNHAKLTRKDPAHPLQ